MYVKPQSLVQNEFQDLLKSQIAYKVKAYGGSLYDHDDDPTLSGNEDEERHSSDRAAEEACCDPGDTVGSSSSSRMEISEGLYDMIKGSARIAFLENILSSASGADENSNVRSRKRPNGLQIGTHRLDAFTGSAFILRFVLFLKKSLASHCSGMIVWSSQVNSKVLFRPVSEWFRNS